MKFRNTLLALIVLGGLVTFIYVYEYKGEPGREEAERAEKSVLNLERDKVEELELARTGEEPVVVRKESGAWAMTSPRATRADEDRVDSLVGTLTSLTIEQTMTDVTEQEKAQFGLAPPAVTVTVRSAGKEPATLLVGEKVPMGRGHYAAHTDGKVLVVSGGLDTVLTTDATSLRYRKVIGVDTWKVARFSIEAGSEKLALARDGDRWKMEAPAAFPADSTRVQNLWFDIQGAEAEEFAAESPGAADLESFGLARPALTLSVEAREGAAPVRIVFGAPDPNGPVYARRSDLESVMKIPRATFDKLKGALSDVTGFRDARVAPVDRFKLTSLEISRPGQEVVKLLKDEESKWHWGSSDGPELPSEQINGVLDATEALKATGFLDAGPAPQPEPALTLTFTEKSGDDTLAVSAGLLPEEGKAGAPRRFKTSAAPAIYLVSPDLVTTLLGSVDAIKAPAPAPAAAP
ncbi:MAG: DUF4340 domain-containing protein [Candidatus Polarisedimenticolia bacterium]